MSAPSRRRRPSAPSFDSYLSLLKRCEPFAQLEAKIIRARAQDEPVLYAHALPGLDLLLCGMRGAQPPYPGVHDLRQRCIENIAHALEQPLDRLENSGYWYDAKGFGMLVFASRARAQVLDDFGARGSRAKRRNPTRI